MMRSKEKSTLISGKFLLIYSNNWTILLFFPQNYVGCTGQAQKWAFHMGENVRTWECRSSVKVISTCNSFIILDTNTAETVYFALCKLLFNLFIFKSFKHKILIRWNQLRFYVELHLIGSRTWSVLFLIV